LLKTWQPCVSSRDDDDAYAVPRYVLLVTEALICGYEDVEHLRTESQQFPVLDRGPAFFLYGSNCELLEIPSQLTRDVLVQEYSPHAI
jgi:hypothetical protein